MYGSTHAVIGDYKELNPKDCGISRLTEGFDKMCYEWHKKPVPPVTAGRGATLDEVPWMVAIERHRPFERYTLGFSLSFFY